MSKSGLQKFREFPKPVQHSLVYLFDALKDPKRPNGCSNALRYSLTQIGEHISFYHLTEESDCMAKFNPLWSHLYRFIVAERTDEEFIAMRDKLSHCSCKPANRSFSKQLHDEFARLLPGQNVSSPKDTLAFVTSIGQLLEGIFATTKDIPVVKGVAKEWPTSVSDLLPSGSDAVIRSLLQWQRFVGNLAVIDFFPSIIRLSTSSIYDSIIKYDAMNLLVLEPIRRCLDETIDALAKERNPLRPTSRNTVYTDFHRMATALQGSIETLYQPPIRSNIRMLNGGETRAVQLCSIIRYLFPALQDHIISDADRSSSLASKIAIKGTLLFQFFEMGRPQCPDIPVHPSFVELHKALFHSQLTREQIIRLAHMLSDSDDIDSSPREDTVAVGMVLSHDYKQCAAPGCDKTFKELGARGFQKCSRCSTVGYCSRECQVRHWSLEGEDSIPHKRVCKILGRIVNEWKSGGSGWHAQKWEGCGGQLDSDRQRAQQAELVTLMKKMQKEGRLTKEEVTYLVGWSGQSSFEIADINFKLGDRGDKLGEREKSEKRYPAGYDDYELVLKKVTQLLKAPPPRCIDRANCPDIGSIEELMKNQSIN
ncbi:hypothetical protein CVT24_002877 [Panaeolus cyanescens]|uniref:MYND-type domain-containing protein n=1 Tax=Panaeolus cyanescens TaxID=181874 RepID=A0A409YRL3_9AGAR|nr:hypothetical protein CVT24_002877 [Panaeolus cyanescens]